MTNAIRLIPLDNAIKHHAHSYHQIVIGLEGHARFEIEGLKGRIAPLSGCIVPANHTHYYTGLGTNRQLIFDLSTDVPTLSGDHRALVQLFDAPRFFTLDESLQAYLRFLTMEMEQPHSAPSELLATTFLGCLHARLATSSAFIKAARLDLAVIDRYIQSHLAQRLSVADLASLVCLSQAHFSDCFRRQTGLSPYQYVLRQRLATARELLTFSRLPLSEVAARTGFSSQSALSHSVRRAFDKTPNQLRQATPIRHAGAVAHV
ncbi:AraC family transcriptional regulator [Halomonas sp. M20]|uniref:AraC family transcriptional regulator n=1 Tax=Halomonas sp. M20 TaxID=2763264 RepID=UPI001D0A5031|nr:helix-turn-helix domain-containing protein [Halomonas sp. M20]